MARLLLAFVWLLHWLPLPVLAALGNGLGALLYRVAHARRRVALRNLELCMPRTTPAEREALAREHFKWLARSILERSLLWYASPARIKRLIHVEGDVQLAERLQHEGRSIMWLCPHFVGLDVAGAAILLCQSRPGASIYQAQSHPVMDAAMKRGRLRLGDVVIFPRSDSIKPLLRAVKQQGRGFFNLPDMDFGLQDAAFVPFFGIPAATLLAPSRMARTLDMVVQPVIAELLPGGRGWRVHFMDPLPGFPTADALADTAALNRWIETQIARWPAQYLWVHKRFKTRPPGEPSLY